VGEAVYGCLTAIVNSNRCAHERRIVLIGTVGIALAGDPWLADPLLPLPAQSARANWRVTGVASWSAGQVPPFRAAERDRLSFGAGGLVWLDRVQLSGATEWLRDDTAAGDPTSGWGDVRLGTVVRVADFRGFHPWIGWGVKLPDASDEDELGTDETDVSFGGGVLWAQGEVRIGVGAGLAVLGNPLRFANQDDVPMFRLDAAWGRGPVVLLPSAAFDLATSRNPARGEVGGGVRVGRSWFVDAGGAAGLTAAAADWRASVGVGWAAALPPAPAGE
jgi:hypothetical protein